MRTLLFLIVTIYPLKFFCQDDRTLPFDNGVSPTTYRFFYPEVNEDGYSMMTFLTEGMDHLNFFGSRLEDLNNDGSPDISMRVLEHLSSYFNSPSTKERSFIRGNIDQYFNMEIIYDNYLLKDGYQYPYEFTDSGYYYFNFDFSDFTIINQIGDLDWRSYYQENNYIENRDYGIMDNDFIHTIPRIYYVKDGEIIDVTESKLEFSEELQNSTAKFMHNQTVASGDFNGDGRLDIFSIGIHQFNGTNLEDLKIENRVIPYLFENISDGKIRVSHIEFQSEQFQFWGAAEGTFNHALNLDNDIEEEVISEIWFSNNSPDPFQDPEATRQLGYFDFDLDNSRLNFITLLNSNDYLEDPEWSISPRYIKKIEPVGSENRELILMYFTSTAGSPPSIVGKLDTFDPSYIQRYLKVFEVNTALDNSNKLTDVTSEFFDNDENRTYSMDNNGLLYLMDVDADGLTDIYIQSGETPVDGRWGSDFINKHPSWNDKPNTLFYFKQTSEGKFKLTNLATIKGYYFPNNFDGDFTVFDNQGTYTLDDKELRIENFTLFNQGSLNDFDNDGVFEILSASDPAFLHLFSKSTLPVPESDGIEISSLSIDYKYDPIPLERYDFSKVEFSKDTLFFNLHDGYELVLKISDESRRVTHTPILYDYYDKSLLYTMLPPKYFNSSRRDTISETLKMRFISDRDYNLKVNKDYISPYLLRFNNDFVVKSHEYHVDSRNIPPLPFVIKESSKVVNAGIEEYDISFSTSVDLNQNFYEDEIGDVKFGVRYGYDLYLDNDLVLTKSVGDDQYDLVFSDDIKDDSYYPTIKNFRISTEGYDANRVTFKIFALDNQDPNLKTYATDPNVDSDGDGIYDPNDQCPNTPEGVIVDTNGCEVFSLPEDVFSVKVVSSTCIDSDNGSINLSTSDSSFNYLYSVDGSDPLPFQNDVTISGLETGSYQICFTVEGISNYNRCYSVNVGEPAPLEASSMVDMDNRTISLNLSGSKSYKILLNGKSISTDNSIISLPLQSGKNTIEVKGDQECQGLYFEEIFVSEEVKVYPNPTNGPLQLYISGMDNQVTVDVTSINGTVVMSSIQSVPMNRVIELNLSDLNPGMYIVSVKGATVQVHQKVIRN